MAKEQCFTQHIIKYILLTMAYFVLFCYNIAKQCKWKANIAYVNKNITGDNFIRYMVRKKIVVLILVMSIIFSCSTPINAQQADNSNSLASVSDSLNKLGLLSGDGNGNYNLDSTLKRTEAMTFLAKLMGKNEYIQNNKDTLKKTKFKDVAETDWFAPYVGFCYSNNIVSGYSEELFGSKDKITEQSFLVMLLKLLKYEDIKWNDNVFKKAYEIGLVADTAYLSKTKDSSSSFTRGCAISTMNTALTSKINGQNNTLLQALINEGSINADIAKSLGYETAYNPGQFINSIKSLNAKQLQVLFNTSMDKASVEDISFYEIRDKGTDVITLAEGAVNYNELTKTAVITLNNNISDRLSNLTTANITIKKGLKASNEKVLTNNLEYAVKVEDFESPELIGAQELDEKTIKLMFSEPIYDGNNSDTLSVENFIVYAQSKEYTIKNAKLSGNTILLSLSKSLEKGTVKLKFNNNILSTTRIIRDYADNIVTESSLSFSFGDNTSQPDVSSVQAINLKQIRIDFNIAMDKDSIQNIDYYEIKDTVENTVSITSESIKAIGVKTALITLNDSISTKLTKGTTAKVKVKKGIKATNGETISEDKEFFVTVLDNSIPYISRAAIIGENALHLIFLEPVYDGTNTDTLSPENFRITYNTPSSDKNPITKEFKVKSAKLSENTIALTSDEVLPEGIYSITINATSTSATNAIQDYAGNKVSSRPFIFKHSKEVTVRLLSLSKIEVNFPIEMDNVSAENIISYEIKDKGNDLISAIPGSISYNESSLLLNTDYSDMRHIIKQLPPNVPFSISRRKTAVISLSRNLTNGTTAKLLIRKCIKTTYSGAFFEDTEVEFPVSDTIAPILTSAKIIGENTIKLTFSETLHSDSDNNSLANRMFSVENHLILETKNNLLKTDFNNKIVNKEGTTQNSNVETKTIPYFVQKAELSGNTITLTLTEKLVDGIIDVTIDNNSTDDNITIKDSFGNIQTKYYISFYYSKDSMLLYPYQILAN